MDLLSPWWLAGLAAVGAVALWALFRPGRQLAVVGSLELWQRAADALDRSLRRRSRRVSASWALILLGCTAGVAALARPVWRSEVQARRIAIEIRPAAEIAGPGGAEELRSAVTSLLARLGGADRVKLVLPTAAGGAGDWVSPSEAHDRVGELQMLPIRAEGLHLPTPPKEAQHVYRFGPAGTMPAGGPGISVIELPARLPGVTIDAIGAVELPAGRMQVLVALRGPHSQPWRGRIALRTFDAAGAPQASHTEEATTDRPLVGTYPAAAALWAEVVQDDAASRGVGAGAGLVRERAGRKKVSMIGPDDPKIRQYVGVDPVLELVAEAKQSDAVIANAVDPPADKPALVIRPGAPPPGWQKAETVGPVLLAEASTAADDPVMRDVDLGAVAVRRMTPWAAGEMQAGVPLATWKGQAIILRNDPDAEPGPNRPPRRVYLAFSVSGENSNFATSEAFVVFLANAMRWLTQSGSAEAGYGCLAPQQAGANREWKLLAGTQGPGALPWPGLYRDSSGGLHAVSLVGLHGSEASISPAEAVASAPLPEPRQSGLSVEFWPWLAAAAMVLCLAGWALRVR